MSVYNKICDGPCYGFDCVGGKCLKIESALEKGDLELLEALVNSLWAETYLAHHIGRLKPNTRDVFHRNLDQNSRSKVADGLSRSLPSLMGVNEKQRKKRKPGKPKAPIVKWIVDNFPESVGDNLKWNLDRAYEGNDEGKDTAISLIPGLKALIERIK